MSKTQTKNFMNAEILNIVEWYNNNRTNQETRQKYNCLPFKVQLDLKRNIETLAQEIKPFAELREEIQKGISEEYFSEEKSDEYEETITDENGQEQTVSARKVKKKYLKDYQKELQDANKKIEEGLIDRVGVNIRVHDFEEIFESLADDALLTLDDIDMLMFMNDDKNTEGVDE